jgi:hypothetical protein
MFELGFKFCRPATVDARIEALAAAGADLVVLWISSSLVFKASAVVFGFEVSILAALARRTVIS